MPWHLASSFSVFILFLQRMYVTIFIIKKVTNYVALLHLMDIALVSLTYFFSFSSRMLQDCFYIESAVGGKKQNKTVLSPQHSLHAMTKGLYHAKQVIIKA